MLGLLHRAAAPPHAAQERKQSRVVAAVACASHAGPRRNLCRGRRPARLCVVRAVHASEAAEAQDEEEDAELLSATGGVEIKAVVKLHCTSLDPDWVNPWQTRTAQRSTGSGVFIGRSEDGEWCTILTAAHVVANTTFVQVQLAGQPDKTTARVKSVAHETDLALVEVPSSLFEGIQPLDVAPGNTLPGLREKVYVLGFPVGGDDLSITEGVVSRIEVQSYSHSHSRALAVTVDAAVNSGNSGGPVVSEESGLIIGVAFQGYAGSDIEGQGHMVPSPIIQRFLNAAGRNPGLPSLGVYLQLLQSPALRSRLRMSDAQTGVLVTSIEHGSCSDGVLRPGDVLLDLDGVQVANDGTCLVLGRRLALAAVLHQRYFGDSLRLTVLRDGAITPLTVELLQTPGLVPRGQYDVTPPYYLCAGLLFQPLCHEYLSTWNELKEAPPHLLVLHYDGVRNEQRTQVVMLTQVLADEANVGYSGESHGMDVVTHIDGAPVKDMTALVLAVQKALAAKQPFIEIDTSRGDLVSRVVVDATQVEAANARIQARYHVPELCSHHFRALLR